MSGHDDSELAYASYWDRHYSKASPTGDGSSPEEAETDSKPTHEWFGDFTKLEPFLRENMLDRPGFRAEDDGVVVLHLGSGDSTTPAELASRGYTHQLCTDFSPIVVSRMRAHHASHPGIHWHLLDVRDMHPTITDASIRVAFDKGTLDAMVYGSPWSPPAEVRERTSRYLREVHRPWFARPLLDVDGLWELEVCTIREEGAFDYFGWVLRKRRTDGASTGEEAS